MTYRPRECGQDFMAGTICSLAPGHDSPHQPICQVCGMDWYENDGCACMPPHCPGCLDRHDPAEACEDTCL